MIYVPANSHQSKDTCCPELGLNQAGPKKRSHICAFILFYYVDDDTFFLTIFYLLFILFILSTRVTK